MKIGVVSALLLAAAACGSYVFPGETPSPTAADGTVGGRVIAVPCAPVEQSGDACTGRVVPNLEIDYLSGVTVEAKAVTGADGTYSVALHPGSYTVRMKTYMRVVRGPLKLTVAAGSKTVADYVLDTGIRLPQPQQ